MTLSLSLATFCRPNSLSAFYSLQHNVHTPSQMHYDEQMAVVVVYATAYYYQELPIKPETCEQAEVPQRLR